MKGRFFSTIAAALTLVSAFGSCADPGAESNGLSSSAQAMPLAQWLSEVTCEDVKRLRLSMGYSTDSFIAGLGSEEPKLSISTLRRIESCGRVSPLTGAQAQPGSLHNKILERVYRTYYVTTRLKPIPFTGVLGGPGGKIEKTFRKRDLWNLRLFFRPEGTSLTEPTRYGGDINDPQILPVEILEDVMGWNIGTLMSRNPSEAELDENLAIVYGSAVNALGMLVQLRASVYWSIAESGGDRDAAIKRAETVRAWLADQLMAREKARRKSLEDVYEFFARRASPKLVDYRIAFAANLPNEVYGAGPRYELFARKEMAAVQEPGTASADPPPRPALEWDVPPPDLRAMDSIIDQALFITTATGADMLRIRLSAGMTREEFAKGLSFDTGFLDWVESRPHSTIETIREGGTVGAELQRQKRRRWLTEIYEQRYLRYPTLPIPVSFGGTQTLQRRYVQDLYFFFRPHNVYSAADLRAAKVDPFTAIEDRFASAAGVSRRTLIMWKLHPRERARTDEHVVVSAPAARKLGMLFHMRGSILRALEPTLKADWDERMAGLRRAEAARAWVVRELFPLDADEQWPTETVYKYFRKRGSTGYNPPPFPSIAPYDTCYPEQFGAETYEDVLFGVDPKKAPSSGDCN